MKKDTTKPRGIRQTMSDLHTWVGLLAGWILYAMFLTGTVSYFKDETSQWARPEVPHMRSTPDPADVAQRVTNTLSQIAAGSPQWSFELPGPRTNLVGSFWRTPKSTASKRAFESASFDPATGARTSARDTLGG
jgi:uncharacterized iron-regulated membrane protein